MSSKSLHIHIDRLVVEGLAHGQQRQFVRALEAQLAEQLPQFAPQAFSSGRPSQNIPRISANALRAGTSPERVAAHVTSALRSAIMGRGTTRA